MTPPSRGAPARGACGPIGGAQLPFRRKVSSGSSGGGPSARASLSEPSTGPSTGPEDLLDALVSPRFMQPGLPSMRAARSSREGQLSDCKRQEVLPGGARAGAQLGTMEDILSRHGVPVLPAHPPVKRHKSLSVGGRSQEALVHTLHTARSFRGSQSKAGLGDADHDVAPTLSGEPAKTVVQRPQFARGQTAPVSLSDDARLASHGQAPTKGATAASDDKLGAAGASELVAEGFGSDESGLASTGTQPGCSSNACSSPFTTLGLGAARLRTASAGPALSNDTEEGAGLAAQRADAVEPPVGRTRRGRGSASMFMSNPVTFVDLAGRGVGELPSVADLLADAKFNKPRPGAASGDVAALPSVKASTKVSARTATDGLPDVEKVEANGNSPHAARGLVGRIFAALT